MSLLSNRPVFASTTFRAQFARFALVAIAALPACGGGSYTWVSAVPSTELTVPVETEYVIQDRDSLAVRVVGQELVTSRVRSDGRISMPLIGDVLARGQTTTSLATKIATQLKVYIVAPVVTVAVQESEAPRVSVIGEVAHPGVFTIAPASGILEALALAGGLTDYASSDRIFVLRSGAAATLRIRFSYDRLSHGASPDTKFMLRSGDTLVIE